MGNTRRTVRIWHRPYRLYLYEHQEDDLHAAALHVWIVTAPENSFSHIATQYPPTFTEGFSLILTCVRRVVYNMPISGFFGPEEEGIDA